MKEWHRTIILLILLGIAVGFLVWAHQTTGGIFVQTIKCRGKPGYAHRGC